MIMFDAEYKINRSETNSFTWSLTAGSFTGTINKTSKTASTAINLEITKVQLKIDKQDEWS